MAWLFSCTLILLLSSHLIDSQNNDKLSIGQSLTATKNGSSWLSPSGDFAFGFSKFPSNNNLFLLSIWYARIPDTIVWYANHGRPVHQQSTVKITANEGLVLSDPEGSILWNTVNDLSGSAAVGYGFMNDTGNFVLKSSDSDDVIWQSFNYPKDTLLPTQVMEAGGEIDSRRSETNFTKGRFQLRFLEDGNLVLNTRDLVTNFAYDAYYISGTNNDNSENAGHKVVYAESGDLYIEMKNGSRFDLTPADKLVSPKNYYQRVTLDVDGVLSWYYHPKNFTQSDGWSVIQSTPEDICSKIVFDLDSGACGYNSICSIGQDYRPNCQCPPSYTLLDPTDAHSNCVPNFKLITCEEQVNGSVGNDQYKIIRLQNTNWPLNDFAILESLTEEDCKTSCLNDCLCAAAIYNDGESRCWKKRLPLSNGITSSGVFGTALLKVGKRANDSYNTLNPHVFPPATKVKYKKNRAVIALLGSSLSVNFIQLCAIVLGIFIMYRKKYSRCSPETNSFSEYGSVHCFTYKELEQATDKFKEEIGRGAFGVVYKGTIISATGAPNSVAVKRLYRVSKDGDKEFETEVNVIGQTHHKNLVRFVGFCKEDDQRLLVYEHMTNGTVADYVFSNVRPSWAARIQIAQGIAQGLLYLHEECRRQIIHCDIKPQNILLDEYQNSRISDFGLAKLLVLNQTHTDTTIRGTKGYVAPEWFRNKPVTVKVDVYSFGVLLLEIICCRKSVCIEFIEQQESAILTDWAFDCYQSNRFDSLVDDDIEALNDIVRLKRLVTVALWCIQEDPCLRPTMRMVTQMIEGLIEVPNGPPGPASFSVVTQY